ncbi:MAG: F0F1 ATP synthase subunit B [Clostridia bacterium]|nr:F0F1 ATP synthase subunit B [Clostridia bacterium]
MRVVLDQFEAFVGVNFFTMIFAWINLVILYVFLKKLLFKPVKKMIDSRQQEIDDMYSEAESSRESANEMKAEYEEKIAKANEESEDILRRAQRRAELREEEILKEANVKAARVLERAEEQIELEKKQAINDVKDEVSSIAIDIAEAVIERDINKADHDALIDEFIDKLGESV